MCYEFLNCMNMEYDVILSLGCKVIFYEVEFNNLLYMIKYMSWKNFRKFLFFKNEKSESKS